jgi:transcription initiation factor TFIIB
MQKRKDEICPNCRKINSLRTDHARGEVVCKECRVVVEDRLVDQTSEWRNFSAEASTHSSDPNRVGGPRDEFASDSGLNTTIINRGTGHMNLLKTMHITTQEAGDKSLGKGFQVINDFGGILRLPADVVNASRELFRRIVKKKKLKGRNLESVVAAVLYVSAKQMNNPRNLKEIIAKTTTVKKEVGRCVRLVKQFSNMGGSTLETNESVLDQLCNKLDVEQKLKLASLEISKNIMRKELFGGKSPYTIASAALYLAALALDPNLSADKITEKANITIGTLKGAVKDIWHLRKDLLPKTLLDNSVYAADKC